jgi:hypothetical protein
MQPTIDLIEVLRQLSLLSMLTNTLWQASCSQGRVELNTVWMLQEGNIARFSSQ